MKEVVFVKTEGLFSIIFEFICYENKNKNENNILLLTYFEFKYVSGIIVWRLYIFFRW